ncbi:hypothetical protein HF313_25525 [Massilia atriviolacea]|uniref:Ribosomal protein S3AE n=1 Tax=Massilia atriviolacea TaxID=2495579 RepID=A0A430HN25_9BURK|nr:hypothetical protein [Massilia atriviolacea]RSZ58966.1 hypothetical protein EJB06_11560 [Massilia atriviolacea]
MLQAPPFPVRTECPPGACVCRRDALLADPGGDTRILRLTREEEKKLLAHIDGIASYAELNKLTERLHSQLGVVLRITPSNNEVRSARGLTIALAELPGLCRKTRQTVPSAIRRSLDRHPEIIYAILDAHDLLGSN